MLPLCGEATTSGRDCAPGASTSKGVGNSGKERSSAACGSMTMEVYRKRSSSGQSSVSRHEKPIAVAEHPPGATVKPSLPPTYADMPDPGGGRHASLAHRHDAKRERTVWPSPDTPADQIGRAPG